jgi:hypothetical protein
MASMLVVGKMCKGALLLLLQKAACRPALASPWVLERGGKKVKHGCVYVCGARHPHPRTSHPCVRALGSWLAACFGSSVVV